MKLQKEHKKDKNSPMFGRKHTEATKEKIRAKAFGRKMSEETKGKISRWNILNSRMRGKHLSEEQKRKIGLAKKGNKNCVGRKLSKETKRKISIARIGRFGGENAPNWQGGISFEPYGKEFNKKLKEKIRKRDNYRCQECFRHQDELYTKTGRKYKLLVHHIDYNKKNNDPNNLIALCRNCHAQTNYKREDWVNYFSGRKQFIIYGEVGTEY